MLFDRFTSSLESLWKTAVFPTCVRCVYERTRARCNCRIFHFIWPRYFPWKNPILRPYYFALSRYYSFLAGNSYKNIFARRSRCYFHTAIIRSGEHYPRLSIIGEKLAWPLLLWFDSNDRVVITYAFPGYAKRSTRGSQREYTRWRTAGKNLGTLRSCGPLPRVKRRVQTSGAVVDASLVHPPRVSALRGSFAGSLEDLSGPLRLPSENLAAGESDRGRAHTLTTLPGNTCDGKSR